MRKTHHVVIGGIGLVHGIARRIESDRRRRVEDVDKLSVDVRICRTHRAHVETQRAACMCRAYKQNDSNFKTSK